MQWLSSSRARAHPRLQEAEVRRIVAHPDVLEQPDRRHRVEAGLGDVAVVAVAHLGQFAQPFVGDGLLRPGRLLPRQRDAGGLDATAGGVAHHAAPAAPDVEQPVARLQPQLLEDEPVLVLLRLLERSVEAADSTRRCRSSTARAPTRRRCSRRRSGGGSPRRRGTCCAGVPRRCGASAAAPPAAAARSAAGARSRSSGRSGPSPAPAAA